MKQKVYFIFVFFSSIFASPSFWRCKNARAVGFTDAPPFDGVFVELHFANTYNQTELEETVVALRNDGVTVIDELCKNAIKRRLEAKQKRKKEKEEKEQRLKSQWNMTELENLCKNLTDAYIIQNNGRWFWQFDEQNMEPKKDCPCFRYEDETLKNYYLHYNDPCAELDCAKKNVVFGTCIMPRPLKGPYNPSSCINKLKIKV